MKNKIISITFLICLSVTGCGNTNQNTDSNMVSIEEYNKVVDERDYYKEQYEKVTTQTENTDITTNEPTDNTSESTPNTDFNYYIDGLSSDEIANECMALLNNVPENGQSIESYVNSFKIAPLSSNITEQSMDYLYSNSYDPATNFPEKNAITRIYAEGMGTQMDGTLAKRTDIEPFIRVELFIHDYDTASATYDALLSELSAYYGQTKDSRNGNKWAATAIFYPTTTDSNGVTSTSLVIVDSCVSLEKYDSGYVLTTRKDWP